MNLAVVASRPQIQFSVHIPILNSIRLDPVRTQTVPVRVSFDPTQATMPGKSGNECRRDMNPKEKLMLQTQDHREEGWEIGMRNTYLEKNLNQSATRSVLVFVHLNFCVSIAGPICGCRSLFSGDLSCPEHLVQPLDLFQRCGLGDGVLDRPHLFRCQSRSVCGRSTSHSQRLSRGEGLGPLLDLLELFFALFGLEQSLCRVPLLWLHLLEVEDPEVGKFVDDKEPVIGLGHDGVVEEADHGDGLGRGKGLKIGQLLDVVVGQDDAVQVGKTLLEVLAKTAKENIEKTVPYKKG